MNQMFHFEWALSEDVCKVESSFRFHTYNDLLAVSRECINESPGSPCEILKHKP